MDSNTAADKVSEFSYTLYFSNEIKRPLESNMNINVQFYERNVVWSAVFEIKWRYDPCTCWTIFKQLSHEPEKLRWLNGIWTYDLCDAGAVL